MASTLLTAATEPSRASRFASGPAIVAGIALFSFLLHLYADKNYGYFIDELYYIACSHHLAWGYVDQPALVALLVKLELLFGSGLHALRFLPAVAAAANILLAGRLAREFGAGRFAQTLAAICLLFAPVYLLFGHLMTMNAFEPLFWMACALLLVRIIKTGNQRLWLCFGLISGLGLNNKYSMGFFGAGVVIGLLLTRHRRMLLQKWIWLGGLIAFLLFLPNLIWNVHHHFPFLQLMANIARSGRNVSLNPWQFFKQQAEMMSYPTAPVWLAGLGYLLLHRDGRRFAPLGWAYLFILLAMMTAPNGRTYYVAPAYPMLFAAGAVWFERLWVAHPYRRRGLAEIGWGIFKPLYAALILLFGALAAPIAIPVLPVETYIRYTRALHLQQPRIETHQLGPLPQLYADMFGWEEMVQVVARAYHALPPQERARTAIVAQNYGQAGAIDFFGGKYGLPKAISSHQSYYIWGTRGYTGDLVLDVGESSQHLARIFDSVQPVGHVYHPYSMPYEHFTIYLCRGLKYPLSDVWRPNWD